MADQTYSNHSRYYPWHHFVVQPILLINAVLQIINAIDHPTRGPIWLAIFATGLLIFGFTSRSMALRAQDRVIRLEERIRLSRLMPGEESLVESLRPGQMVALRFASDDEVAGLARRCASGELTTSKSIKQAIKNWRPDYLRV